MSIESITKRIAYEASEYAKARIAEAEAQKKEILVDAQIKADKIAADAKERADKESALLIERRESVAGLESRKQQLMAKQEVIGESFAKALDKLLSLKEDDYLAFLGAELKAFENEGGEVLLNEADAKKYGAKVEKMLKGNLKMAAGNADIKGGFILKQGDIFVNCSIEKLLEDKKEELTSEIAAKLFQ